MNSEETGKIFKGLGIGAIIGGIGDALLFCWDLLVGIWNCLCGCLTYSENKKGVEGSTYLFVLLICAGIGLLIGLFSALYSYHARVPKKPKTAETPVMESVDYTVTPKTTTGPKPIIEDRTINDPSSISAQSKQEMMKKEKAKEKRKKLQEENTPLFQKYLAYAKEGGIVYNYYVGKDYVYGIKKGDKRNPKGLKADVSKAISFLQFAAEREYDDAQLLLGLVYLGWYDEKIKDEKKAEKWLGRAARLANKDAQFWYGYLLQNGIGVKNNEEEAYFWFLEGANHGNTDAMMKLCHYYMDKLTEFPEEITDKEEDEFQDYVWNSFCWAKYAADYENDEGMYMTGVFYFQGFGVEKDIETSKKYLDLAVENGNKDAQEFIDENF